MTLAIIFAHVWGVLQLVVLGSLRRTSQLSTILIAIPAGVYGCALGAVLLQIAWTRPISWLPFFALAEVVKVASYTLDPLIEEVIKVLPLVFLLRLRNIRHQWSLTDCILIGAALGSGFGLAEALFRFSTAAGKAREMPFGWVFSIGLSPVTVFKPMSLITTWLPESVSIGEIFFTADTPKRINLHLAWSALGGLGVGLYFLEGRKHARTVSLALLGFIVVDHAATNLAISNQSWLASLVVKPLEIIRHGLGFFPVLALGVAWRFDRDRQQLSPNSDLLLKAERTSAPIWHGTISAALSRLPWSSIWVFGLVRMRRAYQTTGTFNTDPRRAENTKSDDDARNGLYTILIEMRDRIDHAWDNSIHNSIIRSLLKKTTLVAIIKQPQCIAFFILIIPPILWFVVGGKPDTAWLQQLLTTTPAWVVIIILSIPTLGWSVWSLIAAARQWRKKIASPIADTGATFALRLVAGMGALALGIYSVLLGVAGASPHDKLLNNTHVLDAISSTPVIVGLLLALLALLLILILPEILAALAALAEALAALGVAGEALAEAAGEAIAEGAAEAAAEAAAEGAAEAAAGAADAAFSALEKGIVNEVQSILSSSEMNALRAAYEAGESAEVTIGGRTVLFEPSLPGSGFSLFGEEGFVIGRQAFASEAELTKTLLHELYRLGTSSALESGVSAATASAETDAAFSFAERAFAVFF